MDPAGSRDVCRGLRHCNHCSDVLADLAVCILGLIMLVVGWNYATTLGGRGFYVSMPWLSRFWMYFPVPLAGVAMIIFEIEALYNHIKSFFVKEEN